MIINYDYLSCGAVVELVINTCKSRPRVVECNPGEDVHTDMPLLPSSINLIAT